MPNHHSNSNCIKNVKLKYKSKFELPTGSSTMHTNISICNDLKSKSLTMSYYLFHINIVVLFSIQVSVAPTGQYY